MVKHMKALLKMGKPLNPPKKPDVDTPYLLWDDNIDDTDPAIKRRQRFHIPPPPVKLPSHAESYNPSPEFLPTQAEAEAFKRIPSNARKDNTFLPRKYNALRHVPVYERTVEDRYRRCLDLFAVTRDTHVKKRYKDPDQLLPTLPSPQDLRPYPCKLGFQYKGHKGAVRSLSVNPGGQYLATGCDDCVVRVFEITSGKVSGPRTLLARPHPPRVKREAKSPHPCLDVCVFFAQRIPEKLCLACQWYMNGWWAWGWGRGYLSVSAIWRVTNGKWGE